MAPDPFIHLSIDFTSGILGFIGPVKAYKTPISCIALLAKSSAFKSLRPAFLAADIVFSYPMLAPYKD